MSTRRQNPPLFRPRLLGVIRGPYGPGDLAHDVLAGVTVGLVALPLALALGIASLPPSLAPTFLQLDIAGALGLGITGIVFTFFIVDLLDNTGTLIGTRSGRA